MFQRFCNRKPVQCRRGRATVFGLIAVSQTLFQPTRYPFRDASSLEVFMAYTAATDSDVSIPSIPLGEILPWAIFGGLLLLLAIYFVGAEQGATAVFKGMYVHEFVHDGRHLLGFPCH
jgi:predicted anti-sigma-YlaC factor YlaD